MKLQKSYAGLIVWMILFLAGMLAVSFLPLKDGDLLIRLVMNECTLGIAALTLVIYVKQAVYWYNGTSFEEAQAAGEERRKTFALRHFRIFAYFAAFYLIYTLLAHLYRLPIGLDIALMCVGLIAAAIRTLPIKL